MIPAHQVLESPDESTAELTSGMEMLSMEDSARSSGASLVRHVTVDPSVCSSSRPSTEQFVPSADLTNQLHGYSPGDLDVKPGKLSLNSTCSVGTADRQRGKCGRKSSSSAPIQNLEIIET